MFFRPLQRKLKKYWHKLLLPRVLDNVMKRFFLIISLHYLTFYFTSCFDKLFCIAFKLIVFLRGTFHENFLTTLLNLQATNRIEKSKLTCKNQKSKFWKQAQMSRPSFPARNRKVHIAFYGYNETVIHNTFRLESKEFWKRMNIKPCSRKCSCNIKVLLLAIFKIYCLLLAIIKITYSQIFFAFFVFFYNSLCHKTRGNAPNGKMESFEVPVEFPKNSSSLTK